MVRAKSDDRRERRLADSSRRDAMHASGSGWTTLNIPKGVEVFTPPKEGAVRFDMVPFEVGDGNPCAHKGEWYYERTFFVHRGIGPNNETYVCPAKTAKKPCPICEHRAALARDPDADQDLFKSLKPKERQVFLIRTITKEGPDDKVKLFESSFFTFGELLDKKRQDAEEDEEHIIRFDDPRAGSTLKASFREKDAGGYKFTECYSIDFKLRPKGLEEELLDHGICLDDVVVIRSYDDLKRLFFQEPEVEEESDEDDEPTPKVKKSVVKKPANDEEEEEDEPAPKAGIVEDVGLEVGMRVKHREFGICKITRISGDGTSLTLKDEEDEQHKAIAVEDVKPLPAPAKKSSADDEEEEPAPKAKTVKKPAPKAKPVEEDDDDWGDDDEEDEPAPKAKATKKTPVKKSADDDWDD